MLFVADGCIENCAQCTPGQGTCDDGHCNIAYTYNTDTLACEGT